MMWAKELEDESEQERRGCLGQDTEWEEIGEIKADGGKTAELKDEEAAAPSTFFYPMTPFEAFFLNIAFTLAIGSILAQEEKKPWWRR